MFSSFQGTILHLHARDHQAQHLLWAVQSEGGSRQSLELTDRPYLLKTLFHLLKLHHQLQLLDALV